MKQRAIGSCSAFVIGACLMWPDARAMASPPAGVGPKASQPLRAEHGVVTLEGARLAITAVLERARDAHAGATVAVVDDGGNLMALERLDGTFAAGALISYGKARTAALFKKPTGFFEQVIRDGRTPMVALNDFTPLQGGVPIAIKGAVLGAIGVSGANSAQQDEEFAIVGANALIKALGGEPLADGKADNKPGAADVHFFTGAAVDAAFARGLPLFETARYKVHASRRDAPGEAEVHEHDTDILRVVLGRATLVTGGRVRDAKPVGPGELRGSAIEGGRAQQLAPGDVMIVPAGTPHWFRQVEAPLTYYVVKTH